MFGFGRKRKPVDTGPLPDAHESYTHNEPVYLDSEEEMHTEEDESLVEFSEPGGIEGFGRGASEAQKNLLKDTRSGGGQPRDKGHKNRQSNLRKGVEKPDGFVQTPDLEAEQEDQMPEYQRPEFVLAEDFTEKYQQFRDAGLGFLEFTFDELVNAGLRLENKSRPGDVEHTYELLAGSQEEPWVELRQKINEIIPRIIDEYPDEGIERVQEFFERFMGVFAYSWQEGEEDMIRAEGNDDLKKVVGAISYQNRNAYDRIMKDIAA